MEAKISKEKYLRKSRSITNKNPIPKKVKQNFQSKVIPGIRSGIFRPVNSPLKTSTNSPGLIQIASWEKCLLKTPTFSIIRPEYETTEHILTYMPEADILNGVAISAEEEEIITYVPFEDESEHIKETNDDQNIITHRRFDKIVEDKNGPFKILKYYRENSLDYDKRKFTPQYKLVATMDVESEAEETNTSTNSPATSSPPGKTRIRPISHQLHFLPSSQSQESSELENISKASKILSKESKPYYGAGLSYSFSYSSLRSGLHSAYIPPRSRPPEKLSNEVSLSGATGSQLVRKHIVPLGETNKSRSGKNINSIILS